MMKFVQDSNNVITEVQKSIVGKEDVIEKIMMAIIAGGHILIEDIPGVGKTTMSLSFSKAMGLKEKRVQFTPDIIPADLTGFSLYKKDVGKFVYQPGAVMCNLLLADEINRTSPKTQSALLEVMEEQQVTIDGVTRAVLDPFIVIATENPEGSVGTQILPDSQLDRFMICIRMGYPTVAEEVEILKRRQMGSPVRYVENVLSADVLISIKQEVSTIYIHDFIYTYIAMLAKATREHELISVGVSPRGTVALAGMSKAAAYIYGRDYVIPDDVASVFICVTAHRVRLSAKAKVSHVLVEDVLEGVLAEVKRPTLRKK